MAVQRAASTKAPVVSSSTPKPAVTLAELGGLAQQVTAAERQFGALRDEVIALKKDRQGATGPRKAALEKRIVDLEGRRDEALDKFSELSHRLGRLIRNLTGPRGGAKLNAKSDSALLGRVAVELSVSRAEISGLRGQKSELEARKPVDKIKLTDVTARLALAETKVAALDAASVAITQDLVKNQTAALETIPEFTAAKDGQLDLVDVASMTRDEQIKLVGAPIVNISEDKAAMNDRRLISISTNQDPAKGAMMRASPAQQLKLVKAAAGYIKSIANQAGSSSVGETYLKALSTARGPARQLMIDALIQSPSDLKPFIELLEEHLVSGDKFEVAGEMMKQLNAAGRTDEAGKLGKSVATSLSRLRGQFETSRTKVDTLNGKLSRATFGFVDAIPTETMQRFRDHYLEKHAADYGAFENASQKYLRALEAIGSFPPAALVKEPQTPMELVAAQKAGPTLDGELTKLAGHSEALLESKAGQQALTAAFTLQLEGKPSLLDTLMVGVKDAKSALSLTKGSADVVARTMVAFTASKGMDAVSKLIGANADLLGISKDKVSSFTELAKQFNAGKLSVAEQKAALRSVSEGGYGKSIKALGMLLTVPGLIDGWSKVGSKSMLEVTKLAADTLGFGNDLAKVFLKAEVIQKLATKAGKALGVVAIPLEVIEGITELFDGKTVDGSMSFASALGAGLMMVPGAQLAGAALILSSAIAKKVWGDDPAERAELAAETEVKNLLDFAGLNADSAKILSDVRQDGLRTMGPFIKQMADHLKMSPIDFMKHLDGLKPKEKLKELVRMAKSMPDDGNWNFPAQKTDDLDRSDMRRGAGFYYIGPKSLATAKDWMRAQGMLPEGK
jgi:hypothetical protein